MLNFNYNKTDLTNSIKYIDWITSKPEVPIDSDCIFDAEKFQNQAISEIAIKIIHRAVQLDHKDEAAQLLKARSNIIKFNTMNKNDQIAVPRTQLERMLHTAYRIVGAIVSILVDLILLPAAGLLLLVALCKKNFDPATPKKDKIPILMIHGKGFNQTEWIVGRQFLKKSSYGSVYSLNLDGIASNRPGATINEYAEKVARKIQEIKIATGQNEVILVGHSMGGLVASCYAETLAQKEGIKVNHVITVSTPWTDDSLIKHLPKCMKKGDTLYEQMSGQYLQDMHKSALRSERGNLRNYYSVVSDNDPLVPGMCGMLSENPAHQLRYNNFGHYGIIAWPKTWLQIRTWLDQIYPVTVPLNTCLDNTI